MLIPINNAFLIGVALSYSMVTISARLAYDGGSNVITFIAFRALIVTLALWALLVWRGTRLWLGGSERNACLGLGVLLALSNFLLHQAIATLPVSIALLIFYTYPVLIAMVGWVTGRDRPTLRVVGALIISLTGLALTLQVKGGPLDAIGLAYAFAASATWGSLMLITDKMLGGSKTQVHTFYMTVCATVVFGLTLILTDGMSLPEATRGWIGFAAAPIFYFMAFVGTMTAVSALGAVRTGFFSNFEAVGVIIFAALILEQYMTPIQMLGAALVIIAMFIFNAPPRRSKRD